MNIAVVGAGAMGSVLRNQIKTRHDMCCVGVIEPMIGETLKSIGEKVDVIIDFSNPDNLSMIEEFARNEGCGVVIATTGFGEKQIQHIKELAEKVPVVFSANFSQGINIMKKILSEVTPVLKESFDMEIIEKHHHKKLDAPSGTAKLLVSAMNPEEEFRQIYGREGNERRGKEIGIHAIRGGTIAGEHIVIFAGEDEILEIKHTANSKKIFAAGALKAATFVVEKVSQADGAGLYNMEDVLHN